MQDITRKAAFEAYLLTLLTLLLLQDYDRVRLLYFHVDFFINFKCWKPWMLKPRKNNSDSLEFPRDKDSPSRLHGTSKADWFGIAVARPPRFWLHNKILILSKLLIYYMKYNIIYTLQFQIHLLCEQHSYQQCFCISQILLRDYTRIHYVIPINYLKESLLHLIFDRTPTCLTIAHWKIWLKHISNLSWVSWDRIQGPVRCK